MASNGALFIFVLSFLICSCRFNPKIETKESTLGFVAKNGMVSCAHPLATEVGLEILRKGGNAFDAAAAVHFALAVVYPGAGNIGGGGFALLRTSEGTISSLDFRERAPLLAHRDMYLDSSGNPISMASRLGHLSAGVPGSVDGILLMHDSLGSLTRSAILKPAIRLANRGFTLFKSDIGILKRYQANFELVNSSPIPFVRSVWNVGDTIKLPDLAKTLEQISDSGRSGFYSGIVAESIIKECQEGNGLISYEDLRKYRSQWRQPIHGTYRDYEIYCMGPPSSGGVALMQLLKGAEQRDISHHGHNSTSNLHYIAELEKRVYADRASHLGDPDFYDVPQKQLLDPVYLKERYSDIKVDKATPSDQIRKGFVDTIESTETTHFSVVDQNGNAASITTTLNGYFGSKVYVQGAGFILNNQMDDFSIKAGVPNQFGLIGDSANAIKPGKRMLSSMTPTIVEKEGQFYLFPVEIRI